MDINWPTSAFQTCPAFAETLQKKYKIWEDQGPSFTSILQDHSNAFWNLES